MKKPCIQCGNDCDILPVQMGEFFPLTYLRICGPECMFLVAYDYIYEIGDRKQFLGALYDKQDQEDKNERDQWVNEGTDEVTYMMGKCFKTNSNMLSAPESDCLRKMFDECTPFPTSFGTMKFSRHSKEDRLKWQQEHIQRLRNQLHETEKDLEALQNEPKT